MAWGPEGTPGIDGAMVHIREEGWKEFKVGAVYAIAERPTRDPLTGEWAKIACAVDNSYVAHLGDAQEFGPFLWSEAQARGWEDARETQTIGDGAHWGQRAPRTWRMSIFRAVSERSIGIMVLNIYIMRCGTSFLPLLQRLPAGSIRRKRCFFRGKLRLSLRRFLIKLSATPLSPAMSCSQP